MGAQCGDEMGQQTTRCYRWQILLAMAVVRGTHFPVRRDTIAQTCPPVRLDQYRITGHHVKRNYVPWRHLRPSSRAPAGRCGCQSIVASGIRNGSCARLLIMPNSYACVSTQLNPSSALSLRTYNHTEVKTSALLRGTRGEITHITERPCRLEVPIAGCRYTLTGGHDLAFAPAF